MTDRVISSSSVKVVQFNKNEELTEDIFSGTSSFSGLKTFLCPEIENIQIRSNFIFVCITPSLFGVKYHLHSCVSNATEKLMFVSRYYIFMIVCKSIFQL